MRTSTFLLALIFSFSAQAFFFNRSLPNGTLVLAKCDGSFHLASISSSFNDRESGYRYFVRFQDLETEQRCPMQVYSNSISRISYGQPMVVYRPVEDFFYHNVQYRYFKTFQVGLLIDISTNTFVETAEVLDISEQGLIMLNIDDELGPAYYLIDDLVKARRL